MARTTDNDEDINRLNETSHYVGATDFKGEATIILHDVAYHLGLLTHEEPVRGASVTSVAAQRNESFPLKLVWLRDHVRQMPPTDDPETLRQYARCYIMLLIRGYLMTDKSNNLVHLRWLPLLEDFGQCHALSWGSAVLAWTYQSLCSAAHRDVTDIAGCTLLLMSWICQRFLQWCPTDRGIYQYHMVARVEISMRPESCDGGYRSTGCDSMRPYDDSALQLCALPGSSRRRSGGYRCRVYKTSTTNISNLGRKLHHLFHHDSIMDVEHEPHMLVPYKLK
ncbi:uncharacterized protein DS421_7g216770 [Arachis hypogaea]|nr:uncharacterized protein DS421_7g216770 [Arachis hypogaea]